MSSGSSPEKERSREQSVFFPRMTSSDRGQMSTADIVVFDMRVFWKVVHDRVFELHETSIHEKSK